MESKQTNKQETISPEMFELIKEVTDAQKFYESHTIELPNGVKFGNDKYLRAIRHKIRNRIFRIIKGGKGSDYDKGLAAWFELQFPKIPPPKNEDDQNGYGWQAFTFSWDVSAKDPLKLITMFEWDGGVMKDTGQCDPPAFTQQKID